MTPKQIAFGERYSDDSGWKRHLSIDEHTSRAALDFGGNDTMTFDLDDAWWLLTALMEARHHLGMDQLVRPQPTAGTAHE